MIFSLQPDHVLALDGVPLLRLVCECHVDKWGEAVPTLTPGEADALAGRIVALLNWHQKKS